jgi:hypothetical protein
MTGLRTVRGSMLLSLAVVVLLAGLVFGVAPAMAEFGVETFALSARNENGTPDVQAGSHPYALNATIVLKEPGPTTGNLRDVRLELPPGLVGNPDATPRCTYQEFIRELRGGAEEGRCPNDTAIGLATFYIKKPGQEELVPSSTAVYNLVPPAGVAAEFGYMAAEETPVLLQSSVRSGKDYGITTTAPEINQEANIYASKVTIWGTPAAAAHDHWRGTCLRTEGGHGAVSEQTGLHEGEDELEGPLRNEEENQEPEGLPESTGSCEPGPGVAVRPLLRMPSSCGRPLSATVAVDSWQEPGDFVGAEGQRTKTVSLPEMTGCESLSFARSAFAPFAFEPTVSVVPEKSAGSSASGLEVSESVPQEVGEAPEGLAQADVKDTTLVFPVGVELNASAANGLEGCSIGEIGYTGMKELDPSTEPGVQTPQFEERVRNPETGRMEADLCPDASKVANVRIKTPLLEGELVGAVYLAAPQNFETGSLENPFRSLTAFYGVAEEPRTGVLVKFPGNLERNIGTGQLTGTVENLPQQPFSEAHLDFFGGERAAFATPALCGTYQAHATITPWSGTPAATPAAEFNVRSGPGGSGCPSSPLPFSPSLQTGTTNNNAGGFSPVSTVVARGDGEQAIHNVTISYPPGFSAVVAGVPECSEAQANAGTCGEESKIGEDTAEVGLGGDPYTVTGGKVYLTGPYDGAPFGLSIVTPAQAGPFVLEEGRPVVTRAKIEINPVTAAVTVTSGEIPQILDRIHLQIKQIYVNINRNDFAINPTSCERMSVGGSVGGWEGANALVSDPFQVADCSALKFEPSIAVSTGGHSSKKDGASLNIKVSYPAGSLGTQAWFKEAKLVIPKQLPAELKTIQQACPAATFEANRAACPVHSKIGEAIVHTQLLAEPVKGPIYFVSFGNLKFPDAIILLSGDNVNIRLTSETLIENGVTSVTLPEIPGVPVESSEFNLPAGEYAEFGANLGLGDYDFCGHKLTVPTEFKAQNGLEFHQETPVTITGCPTSISIQSKSIKKRTLTLTVYVPGPGKLTATGHGLPTRTKTAKGQELLTFTLTPKTNHKLKTNIHITYTPTKGKKQTTTTHTTIKR